MQRIRVVSYWNILLPVVPALFALLLLPHTGEHDQNMLAEVVGSSISESEGFSALAADISRFGWAMIAVIAVVGTALPFLVRRTWCKRLREYDAERVKNFRPLFWKHLASAALIALIIGIGLIATAPNLRALPPLAWTIASAGAALAAILQYMAATMALSHVRRLMLGR